MFKIVVRKERKTPPRGCLKEHFKLNNKVRLKKVEAMIRKWKQKGSRFMAVLQSKYS